MKIKGSTAAKNSRLPLLPPAFSRKKNSTADAAMIENEYKTGSQSPEGINKGQSSMLARAASEMSVK